MSKSILKNGETPHDYRIKFLNPELKLLEQIKPLRILEVFSGSGDNLCFLSEKGFNVVGVESKDKYIEKSRTLISNNDLNIKVNKVDVFKKGLPFDKDKFDFVYSYQYINHNFKNKIEYVFKEIFRVLNHKGVFSLKISDADQFNFKHVKDDLYEELDPEFGTMKYRKLAEQTFAKLSGDEKDIPHYGFTKDELLKTLTDSGFEIINIRVIKWNFVVNCTKS